MCGEKSRFERLMEFFSREDRNVDFMVGDGGHLLTAPPPPPRPDHAASLCVHQVACMQFINIMVHSVENMNFRVHLQHQFTCHGLDEYLEVVFGPRWTSESTFKNI